jgi:hypothetical protein
MQVLAEALGGRAGTESERRAGRSLLNLTSSVPVSEHTMRFETAKQLYDVQNAATALAGYGI